MDGSDISGAEALATSHIICPRVAMKRVRRVERQGYKHALFSVVGTCACDRSEVFVSTHTHCLPALHASSSARAETHTHETHIHTAWIYNINIKF
jgi:hypothetical protein